jgi:hypothetical protein
MDKINCGRLVLAGLVAGVVLNIGEALLNTVVLGSQMEQIFRRFNVQPPGARFIAIAVVMTFVLGLVIVFVYTLIRPRLGPGPKTAIWAAVIVWFCAAVYPVVLNALLFELPVTLVAIGLVWALVEYSLAALVGGSLYKES